MKIFADENIPSRTVEELRSLGHDVLDIRGTVDQGMDDEVLWARLLHEGRLLVTTDKGFAQHRRKSQPISWFIFHATAPSPATPARSLGGLWLNSDIVPWVCVLLAVATLNSEPTAERNAN